MKTRVFSRNTSGKRQWVADFAYETTAKRFVDESNRVYAGHLVFSTEPGVAS